MEGVHSGDSVGLAGETVGSYIYEAKVPVWMRDSELEVSHEVLPDIWVDCWSEILKNKNNKRMEEIFL